MLGVYCFNFVPILGIFCSNFGDILFQFWGCFVPILGICVPILGWFWSYFVQISGQMSGIYCSNFEAIFCSNFGAIFCYNFGDIFCSYLMSRLYCSREHYQCSVILLFISYLYHSERLVIYVQVYWLSLLTL